MSEQGFFSYDLSNGAIEKGAHVAVLGIPEPSHALKTGWPSAPDVFRRVSQSTGMVPPAPGIDLGNTEPGADWAAAMRRVVAHAKANAVVPIFLGGDACVRDAALALWPDVPVIAASYRMTEALSGREVLWLGLNGPQPARLWADVASGKHQSVSARAIDDGASPVWPDNAVLWLDAAVFDTGHAAGAIEVNPAGVAPDALVDLLARWSGRVEGIVVSGATPERDPRGLTELALVRIIADVLRNV